MAAGKIVIVNMRSPEVRYLPTYELFLAEAMTRAGTAAEVGIYTLLTGENKEKYLEEWKGADAVLFWEAFSTKAPGYAFDYFELAAVIRRSLGVPVIFGGFWATSYGRHFREFEAFDALVEGYSIDGVAKALSGGIRPEERYLDARGESGYDRYPLVPGYLKTPEKYMVQGTLFGYMSSFGCPRNCTFCFANAARKVGSGFAARDARTVRRDLEALEEFFGFQGIVLKDLNLFHDRERAFEILHYLRDRGKRIDINLDITLRDMDDEVLRELEGLGIVRDLYFGLESFNEETRKRVRKPYSDGDLERAFALAEKHGINLTGNVIIGLPWHTREEVEREIARALEVIERYRHVFIMMNVYKPEYGTELQESHFQDLHEKITFRQLIDLYLNNASKYQNLVYGEELGFIDLEMLFNTMRLVNRCKRSENASPPRRAAFLAALGRRLRRQLRPPYFRSRPLAALARRRRTDFVIRRILPLFEVRYREAVPRRLGRLLASAGGKS